MSESDGQPAFVSRAVASEVLDIGQAIAAIREAYSHPFEAGIAPPRTVARSHGARLRTLSAIMPTGDLMGAKLLAQPRSGPPTYLIVLFAQDDGRLVALLDGEAITAVRTAATSAVAVDALAPPQPLNLGMLGSGHEARAHLRALAVVRRIEKLTVFSPRPARREAFAAWARAEFGIVATAVDDARSAVADATTVVTAARNSDDAPVLYGEWLRDDALLISIGSTLPEQRDLDVSALAAARLIIADLPDDVLHSSGDGIAAAAAGDDLRPKTWSLQQLVQDEVHLGDGRGIVVFKSVGSAIQDLAVAQLALSGARSRGLTTPACVNLEPKER